MEYASVTTQKPAHDDSATESIFPLKGRLNIYIKYDAHISIINCYRTWRQYPWLTY